MTRDFRLYIDDILQSIDRIGSYVQNIAFEEFVRDQKTIDAIIRNFEIIGEAAKNIPEHIITDNPDVPWKEMAGMRDVLIHAYFRVDLGVLWKTAKERIPELKKLILQIT